jgi:hypothetical protein
MIKIIPLAQGIEINGINFPNNTLSFSVRGDIIDIFLAVNNKKIITSHYNLFLNQYDQPYLTAQSVIDDLLLNNVNPSNNPALDARVTILEDNEYKITYWTPISTDSGTITKPTNSTILLDSFMEGVDALVETIVNGQPSGFSPTTSGGAYVTVSSFDSAGNYTLSDTPSSFDVALLYVIKIKAIDLQNIDSIYTITAEPVKEVVQTILQGDTEHAPSSNTIFDAFQEYNTVFVETNPGPGEFSDLDTALASITTSSPTNYFKVQLGVGTFPKGTQTTPSYVSIVGASIQTTFIEPSGASHGFELTNPFVEISFLTIINAPGAGIYVNDAGDYTQAHKVSFLNCDTNVLVESVTQDTIFYGEYLDYNGTYSFGTKLVAVGGFKAFANVENYYNLPTAGTVIGNYATGVGAELIVLASGQKGFGTGTKAIYLEDGAILNMTSTDMSGWGTAIEVGNVGAAPNIIISGVTCLDSTDWDIYIAHPGTTGTIQGAFDEHKLTNNGTTESPLPATVGILLQGTADNSITVNGDINGIFGDYITDVAALIVGGSGMGLLGGGYLYDGTGGTGLDLSIVQGLGYLLKADGTLIKYPFPDQTFTIPDNSQGYVYFNSNLILTFGGSIPSLAENIFLGYVGTRGGVFEFISSTGMQAKNVSNKYADLFLQGFGAVYSSGSLLSENTTPFHLDISTGVYYISSNHLQPAGGVDITFKQYYNTGGSTFNISSTNVINNTDYNTGGALVPLTAGYYCKHSAYVIGGDDVVSNEQYFVVIAQDEYSSLLSAQQATVPLPPSYFTGDIVLIGTIIIQEGATNIVEFLDNRPILGAIPAGVSASADHTSLLNLTAGNSGHTQFMMLDGSTPMAADLPMGGNNIANVGTVNNVVVETHVARHNFNGADPLLSAVPQTVGTANAEGVSNTQVSRADHVHAHGNQTSPTQHAVATVSANGFMSSTDKTIVDALPTTYQPLDADLTSIAGLSSTSSYLRRSAANTYVLDSYTTVAGNMPSTSITAKLLTGGAFVGDINATDSILQAFETIDGILNTVSGNLFNLNVGQILVGAADGVAIPVTPTLNASGGSFGFNAAGVLTFPDAGAATRGLITTGTQSIAGNKTFTGTLAASNLSGTNTGDQTITLTGEATGSGTGSFAVTLTNSAVIGKVLTGYVSGAGTVSATDTILQAIQKLNGNASALVTGVSSVNSLTGAVALTGTVNRLTISGANVFDISATFEALLGKVANPLSQFASTTSAQLAGVISDETGSGALVFATSPALTGSPTAPTQSALDNSTKIATTAYVNALTVSPKIKSGVVAGGTFAGSPKKVTVTFSTAFADANYSISIIGENSRTWSVESVVAGSFVINANANTALSGNVYWTATKHGEN